MALLPEPVPQIPLRDNPREDSVWKAFLERLSYRTSASSQIAHNSLAGLQGGSAGDYYHLTASQQANVTSFLSQAPNRILITNSVSTITTTPDLGYVSGTSTLSGVNLNFSGAGGNIFASTYTPTLTNAANLDGSTSYSAQFIRVQNVVTVSGKVDIDPTAPAAATRLGISLPVASNLGAEEECAGTAAASGIAGQVAAIRGDAANDRAEMVWVSGDITVQPMYYTFQYHIL